MARRSRAITADGGERLVLLALAVFVGVFAVWPVARLLIEAGGAGLDTIASVWARPPTRRAFANTLTTASLGTLLSLALGIGFALAVALTDMRAKTALVFCFMLPMMIAPQVTALAWLQVFGPNSALLNGLGLAPPPGSRNPLHGPEGIILLFGLQHAPLVFLAVRAGLRNLPGDLIEAAQAAGARPGRIVRTIVLPLLGPAIAAGGGLAFVSAIGNFGIPALLGIPGGYPVLVTLIYQRLAGFGPQVLPEIGSLSLLLFAVAALGLWLQRLHGKSADVRVVSLAAAAPGWRLGRFRTLAEAVTWAVLAMVLVLPLLSLIATSLVPAYGVVLDMATVTLDHYAYVLLEHRAAWRAFVNSTLLAGGAAVVLMVLVVPLAVLADWRKSRAITWLAIAAEFPYALPGVVLAIAMILVFLKPLPVFEIGLYNTVWIIFAAYLARFLTLAWRPAAAGLLQIDRSLDEAAQGAGARFLFRLRTVVYPMLAPTAAAGGILVFLTAFNELTVSALLWSSGAETLGVILFSFEQAGESTAAAAVAVLTVVATVLLMLAGSAFRRHLPSGVLPWQP